MAELNTKLKSKKYIRHNGLTVVYQPPPPEKISPKNLETFYNSLNDSKGMVSPEKSKIMEVTM
jgi:hypothetical protein